MGEIIAQNTYINDGIGRPILITDARGNKTKNDYNVSVKYTAYGFY